MAIVYLHRIRFVFDAIVQRRWADEKTESGDIVNVTTTFFG